MARRAARRLQRLNSRSNLTPTPTWAAKHLLHHKLQPMHRRMRQLLLSHTLRLRNPTAPHLNKIKRLNWVRLSRHSTPISSLLLVLLKPPKKRQLRRWGRL